MKTQPNLTCSRLTIDVLILALREKYIKIIKEKGFVAPIKDKQDSILGIGPFNDVIDNWISVKNFSLSHVVYFVLKSMEYDFDENGFPNLFKGKRLTFQGQTIQKAIQAYNRGEENIDFSVYYLNAYLKFLDLTLINLEENSQEFKIPERLSFLNNKGPIPDKLIYDVFLGSPKITIGKKSREDFPKFKEEIEATIVGANFTELERVLLQHFFGFIPENIPSIFDDFEKYMIGLKTALKELGLNVFDSRDEKSTKKFYGMGNSASIFKRDINAIEASKSYILVAPFPRLFTSAWIESGVAIGKGKPCLFVCNACDTDLPFVLHTRSRQADIDIETAEFKTLPNGVTIETKIVETIDRIKEWGPLRCSNCWKESGDTGMINGVICPTCEGTGIISLARAKN